MFAAQLYNKLTRSEEDMEDLLTSNVFGVWRYLPQLGLLQFLKTAQRLDGVRFAGLDEIESADLQFWPWMQEEGARGAEPDVLIEMTSSDRQKWLVLIEAKYLSGKSSLPDERDQPNDQLAREMHNLRRVAARKGISQYALIYVTAHTLMPRADIEQAVSELGTKTGDGAADRFYWTTWRRLPAVLSEANVLCQEPFKTMLSDLEKIVRRTGLTFFEGVTSRGWTLGETRWAFERPPVVFEWMPINIGHYTFEKTPIRFSWVLSTRPDITSWRWT